MIQRAIAESLNDQMTMQRSAVDEMPVEPEAGAEDVITIRFQQTNQQVPAICFERFGKGFGPKYSNCHVFTKCLLTTEIDTSVLEAKHPFKHFELCQAT
jgi:hypothetical protein